MFTLFFEAKRQAARAYNPLREVTEALEGLPVSEEAKTALLLQAHRVRISREVPPEAITEWLTSPAGCAFYGWLLIRVNHPGITLEHVRGHIDEQNCLAIFADLDEASGARLIMRAMEDSGLFRPAAAQSTATGSSSTAPGQAGSNSTGGSSPITT